MLQDSWKADSFAGDGFVEVEKHTGQGDARRSGGVRRSGSEQSSGGVRTLLQHFTLARPEPQEPGEFLLGGRAACRELEAVAESRGGVSGTRGDAAAQRLRAL